MFGITTICNAVHAIGTVTGALTRAASEAANELEDYSKAWSDARKSNRQSRLENIANRDALEVQRERLQIRKDLKKLIQETGEFNNSLTEQELADLNYVQGKVSNMVKLVSKKSRKALQSETASLNDFFNKLNREPKDSDQSKSVSSSSSADAAQSGNGESSSFTLSGDDTNQL